jgi:hypothetical protein
MTFVNEFLVGAAFPASRGSTVRPVALHTEAPRAARARLDVPVESAVDTLDGVHLDDPEIRVIDSGVAVGVEHHSSQAMVQLMLGVAPEAILRKPSPFAVPTAALISRPGFAFQV